MTPRITRRHALRGLGTAVALPFLEAMVPAGAMAAAAKPPVRLVWLYAGSGMFMPAYKPAVLGKGWESSAAFAPDTLLTNGVQIAPEVKPLSVSHRCCRLRVTCRS